MTETPEQHGTDSDEAAVAAAPTPVPADETPAAPAPEDAAAPEETDVVEVTEPVAETEVTETAEVPDETAEVSAEETSVEADAVTATEPTAEAPADDAAPVEDSPSAVEAEPETAEAAVVEAPATPTPAPRPGPRPPLPSAMRPRPRPAAGSDVAATTAAPSVPVVPVAVPDDSAEAAAATAFGRVDDEGTVYVREQAGERAVGQFPGATADEALALYVRRFLDLQAKITLFEARLTATDLAVKEIDQTLARLTEELTEPAAVGDLDTLRTRLEALRGLAGERRAAVEAERSAAKQAAVESRTAIVEKAEKIAGTDPARMQWRPAGEQLRALLDEWKEAQRSGPRIDRTSEESLWKRFSHARTTFDRERRHYFAELESRNAGAKSTKEEIVREAERLSSSTEWGATAGAYRDLMARWKSAGRASRADDDALWARFRAAQDAFFQARDDLNAATDREYQANLEVKEALLVEAEAIDPARGLGAAKGALRSIQERWEAAGKVPRADIQRVEARLRAVETAVRDADQAEWRRTNPETRARAEGAAAQLENAIAQLEADLATAQASGDTRRVKEAQAALDARRAWLEQVQRAAQ
ncbi:MAG TPA: DUF349 domain-containing protein, partial [Friedmanniella sp.]